VADVHAYVIDLEVNGDRLLFILLSADGSLNRIGSGTLKDKNRDMFIGVTDPAIFERVRSHLTEAMLQGLGHSFQRQNIRGAPCKLTLVIQFNDGKSASSEYLYGARSEGPPSAAKISRIIDDQMRLRSPRSLAWVCTGAKPPGEIGCSHYRPSWRLNPGPRQTSTCGLRQANRKLKSVPLFQK
jgi:hypothetical protein